MSLISSSSGSCFFLNFDNTRCLFTEVVFFYISVLFRFNYFNLVVQ